MFTFFAFLFSRMHVPQYYINPLVPEFKLSAEPINAGDIMAAPRRELISMRITLYSLFLQPKRLQ